MNYPVAPYGVVPVAPRSNTKKILIIVGVVVASIILIGIIAIGLGVGLGVGLTRNNDGSSSSSSSSGGGSSGSSTSILSAPSVTCTYGGSDTCGCSPVKPAFLTPKITNGYGAVPNSWPWLVAVYTNNNRTFCGGFLVTYQHVITAAHCVSSLTGQVLIYAGLQTLSSRNGAQARVGSTFSVHPNYNPSTYVNDIAVVTLATPFNSTSIVGKCCLPTDTTLPTSDEHGVISGWGFTATAGPAVSNTLMQGVIKVQSDSVCGESSAGGTRFCAGYNGTDSCFGDSGSPFMTSVNNLWTCTGIVSAGRDCGIATLYTRVSAFQSFINGIING